MFRETHVDSEFSSRYPNSARPTAQLWNTGVKERKIEKILRSLTKWTPKLGGQAVIKNSARKFVMNRSQLLINYYDLVERRGTDCSASFVGKETKWQTLELDVCHKKFYEK